MLKCTFVLCAVPAEGLAEGVAAEASGPRESRPSTEQQQQQQDTEGGQQPAEQLEPEPVPQKVQLGKQLKELLQVWVGVSACVSVGVRVFCKASLLE